MYGDSDFPSNDASSYFNPTEPLKYDKRASAVEWMRPEEALNSGDSNKVAMIKDGTKHGDLKLRIWGYCRLFGSIMIWGTHPEIQKKIYYEGLSKVWILSIWVLLGWRVKAGTYLDSHSVQQRN